MIILKRDANTRQMCARKNLVTKEFLECSSLEIDISIRSVSVVVEI